MSYDRGRSPARHACPPADGPVPLAAVAAARGLAETLPLQNSVWVIKKY